jgi:hypothetical protein
VVTSIFLTALKFFATGSNNANMPSKDIGGYTQF